MLPLSPRANVDVQVPQKKALGEVDLRPHDGRVLSSNILANPHGGVPRGIQSEPKPRQGPALASAGCKIQDRPGVRRDLLPLGTPSDEGPLVFEDAEDNLKAYVLQSAREPTALARSGDIPDEDVRLFLRRGLYGQAQLVLPLHPGLELHPRDLSDSQGP
eukprot:UN1601